MKKQVTLALSLWLLLSTLLLTASPAHGDEGPQGARRAFAARSQTSASALAGSQMPLAVSSPDSFAAALDIPASLPASVSSTGDSSAAATFVDLGVIKPTRGTSFLLLSTGVAGSTSPEPGTDLGASDMEGDAYEVRIALSLPEGVRQISFDYNFLSAELPDFLGSSFNDTFRALLVDKYGTREIARASVNSSPFIPASAAVAAGSGFDIFTADPAGIDTIFGGGLPDAGLTRFVSVNALIHDPQTTLVFSVADLGDGIFDSAVLLDNLGFTSIEALDPIDGLLDNGSLTSDLERLSTLGRPVKGIAADGVTRLLLRTRTGGPGNVELCLEGGAAPQDGGLRLLGGSGRSGCITAPVQETSQGPMAFALYVAPDDFNRGGDTNLKNRPITLRARYLPASGGQQVTRLALAIERPPLVLIHGLWSNSGTWTFPLARDPRFRITLVDYSSSHASRFATNRLALFSNNGIRVALADARGEQIAVTQVDVAGHSMGGLLTRIYSAAAENRRAANYFEGDLNRLVTLNTPHTGSPLANVLVDLRDAPLIGGLFTSAMAGIHKPINHGAIDDLAKGSAALSAIGTTELPAHALAGIGGSDALMLVPGDIGRIYTIINFFANYSTIFQGLQHDAVVGRQSQEGGLPPAATTVYGGLGSIHTFVTGDGQYSSQLAQLLNTPLSDSSFANFPAVSSIMGATSTGTGQLAQLAAGAIFTDTLSISGPPPGAIVQSGATVHVSVTAPAEAALTKVLFVGPETAIVDDAAPFEIDLPVPAAAIGPFTVQAIGSDAAENYYTAPPVTYSAEPAATLIGVSIQPREMVLFVPGEQRGLTVLGSYSDGITRTLMPGTSLVSLLSSDPQYVQVAPDGTVTAAGIGVATVVAQAPGTGLQDSITVQVTPENLTPLANAGQNRVALVNTLVILDGSASSDPDAVTGEALSYDWQQVEGPPAGLADAATPFPFFTPTEPGTYTFGLVVRDAQSESPPATVRVRVVASNEPPTANAGPDQTVEVGDLVTLDASGSVDPDGALGDLLAYEWQQSGGPAAQLSDPAAAQPTFVPTELGTYTFTVTVSDSLSASAPAAVVVTVLRKNLPPEAHAGADQRAAVGATVTLDGSQSSDPDLQEGEALTYTWEQTAGPPVTLADAATATPSFVVPAAGTYTFSLVVRDGRSASQPATVAVQATWTIHLPTVRGR